MSYEIFHEKVDLTKAKQITKKAVDKGFADNRAMYDGDHWGGSSGRFWVGPHADKHPSLSGTLKSELERLFVCRNVIKEITTRHINPLAAHWKITVKRPLKKGEPVTEAEQTLIDEAEALLQTWLDERLTPMDDEQDEDDPIQAALVNLLLNGRATMRLFIPRDNLNLADDGTPFVPTGSLEETAKRIFLHSPSPQDARLWRYENSQQQIGIYADKDEDEFNLSDTGQQEYAEMTYLDPEDNTVLRIVSDGRPDQLGGRWNKSGKVPLTQAKRKCRR